jgi:chorismate mutase
MKNNDTPAGLGDLRDTINAADFLVLQSLAMRFKAVTSLHPLKKKLKLPVTDKRREVELKKVWKAQAKKLGIRQEFALTLLYLILGESKHIQSPK